MAILTRPDASLYYEVHGDGEPLLCIMGLGGNIHFWEFQIPAFAGRHRTIAFDNRGAGRSDKPPGPYTMQQLADDALALLDELHVERAHVIGISMGGMIAQTLTLAHPERVASLILAATFAKPDDAARTLAVEGSAQVGAPSPLDMLRGGAMDLTTVDVKQLFKFMMTLILTPDFIQREKAWLRSLLERAQSYGFSVEAFMSQVSAIMRHDTVARLGEVKAPTLVMTGTADVLVPPHHSDELAKLIPGARLVRIDGGTHGFNVERREEFNEVVLDFLREHPLT
jgi:pimeloyl-ACP methyl ester carboxylesterase